VGIQKQKSDLLFDFGIKIGKVVFGTGKQVFKIVKPSLKVIHRQRRFNKMKRRGEPKVVNVSLTTGHKVYWCPKNQRQVFDQVCIENHFSRSSKYCRLCLGIEKGQHWPEPWDSIGKQKEQANTVVEG
jgi:hypothetical protein